MNKEDILSKIISKSPLMVIVGDCVKNSSSFVQNGKDVGATKLDNDLNVPNILFEKIKILPSDDVVRSYKNEDIYKSEIKCPACEMNIPKTIEYAVPLVKNGIITNDSILLSKDQIDSVKQQVKNGETKITIPARTFDDPS